MTAPTPTETQNWFDFVASIFLDARDADGRQLILAAHGGGRGVDAAGARYVQPQVDTLDTFPTAVLGHSGIDPLVHGPWQRQTHNLVGSIWIPRNPLPARFAEAIDLIDPVMEAFERHVTTAAHPRLKSVVLKTFEGITALPWPPPTSPDQPQRWFLVTSWAIEAQVNRAATYQTA